MPKTGKRKHVDLSDRVHAAICARQDQEKFIGTPTNFIENVLMQRASGESIEAIIAKHVAELERRLTADMAELKKWLAVELHRGGRDDRYVGGKYLGPERDDVKDRETGT